MIQRAQSIYLGLFIIIALALLSNISILEFQGNGVQVDTPLIFSISAQRMSFEGQLSLNDTEKEIFTEALSDSPFTYNNEHQTLEMKNWSPLFFAQLVLVILALITLFSYKNLKRQTRLVRITVLLTFFYAALIMFLAYFTTNLLDPYLETVPVKEIVVTRHLKLGFYLTCALFPLAILAQIGIKRDYSLIKSLDRLR
jgi:magnesium-transporting ATPase (P-type)